METTNKPEDKVLSPRLTKRADELARNSGIRGGMIKVFRHALSEVDLMKMPITKFKRGCKARDDGIDHPLYPTTIVISQTMADRLKLVSAMRNASINEILNSAIVNCFDSKR